MHSIKVVPVEDCQERFLLKKDKRNPLGTYCKPCKAHSKQEDALVRRKCNFWTP